VGPGKDSALAAKPTLNNSAERRVRRSSSMKIFLCFVLLRFINMDVFFARAWPMTRWPGQGRAPGGSVAAQPAIPFPPSMVTHSQ
jgi:hypothetical protein